MKITKTILLTLMLALSGCAQVPKEAVELSTTVGRDLAEMRRSHTQFVKIYYDNNIKNINEFIDNVYLPYQIQNILSDDEIRKAMLSNLEEASRVDVTGIAQKSAYQNLISFHLLIHQEVEEYRQLKLAPVVEQYEFVLKKVNDGYEKIHYANSIVTGHLASVVEVHDAQNKVLEQFDLKDLRAVLGNNVAEASDTISELTSKAKEKERDLDELIRNFEKAIESVTNSKQ